jgi:hypothetical protein
MPSRSSWRFLQKPLFTHSFQASTPFAFLGQLKGQGIIVQNITKDWICQDKRGPEAGFCVAQEKSPA